MIKLCSTKTLLFTLVAGASAIALPSIAAAQQFGPPPGYGDHDRGPADWGPPPPDRFQPERDMHERGWHDGGWRDRGDDDGDRGHRWQDNSGNWHMPNGWWVDCRGHWHDGDDEHWRSRSWNRRQTLYQRRGWDDDSWR